MNNLSSDKKTLISVVIPAYNEQEVLEEFHSRLSQVFSNDKYNLEAVYVNDGSLDNTLSLLGQMKSRDERIAIVDLSRNFGKEIALTAGLDHASGDAVIVIDADLQDPPELIPDLIREWQGGYDVVYAMREERLGETRLKLLTANLFYRFMQNIGGSVTIPKNTGDFRLLSRRAVDALKQLREQHRFMKGLFAWIGFPQKEVIYKREARYAGETKWNYWKLWNFALEGITSFTTIPLKISTYLGLVTAFAAFVYGAITIFKTIIYGNDLPGYPSLLVIILFLGGIQLIAVGVIGEYLGRMFNETKNRPLYFVNHFSPKKDHPALTDNDSNTLQTDGISQNSDRKQHSG